MGPSAVRLRPRFASSGWLSCVSQGACLRLAWVEPGDRPGVRWLHTEPVRGPLAAALHRARRAAPGKQLPLAVVLERGRYQLLQTEAPDMPREEWRDALRWRLKDQLEFPVEGAAIDLLALPPQAGPRNQRTLIAVVEPATVRHEWQRAGEDAGWRWQAVDIVETALRNLSTLLATPGRGHALLHLGQTHATLVITVAGALLLSRQIEVARDQLASEDESLRMPAMERAGLELQRTLDGFDRVFSQVGLERLDLLPAPGADAFADFARELVYVPVKVADIGERLDCTALPSDASLSEHWVAIGAALRRAAGSEPAETEAQGDLNLDPPTARAARTPWRATQGLAAAAGALALSWLAATGLQAWTGHRQLQATALLQALPQQHAQLEARDPGAAEAVQRLAAERQRLQVLDAEQRRLLVEIDSHLKHAANGYTPFFAALSRQSQGTVWITGFSVAGSSGALELQGRMTDPAALPGYLQRLNQEEAFKGRQFARLQLTPAEGLTEFTLGGLAALTPEAPSR
jgi:MSHA biogenesis protein MshI